MNHNDLDQRLDKAIDALNNEASPAPYEQGDPELFSLVDAARLAKSLRQPAEPDADFAALAIARISADLRQSTTTGNTIPPGNTPAISALPEPGHDGDNPNAPLPWFHRYAELAAILLVLVLVGGGIYIYQSMLSNDDGTPAIGGTETVSGFDLYILMEQLRLQPLNATTLADNDEVETQQLEPSSGFVQSADGSTVVTITYGSRLVPTDENLAPDEIEIVITNGLNGSERARFHPPTHVHWPVLSNDGSRLVVQSRVEYDSDDDPVWYIFDTTDGSITGTVEREHQYGYDVMFFGVDPSRLYRAAVRTSGPALQPAHLEIIAYNVADRTETDRLELPGVPTGIWSHDPESQRATEHDVEPAVVLSPDASTIAVVHAHEDAVTLIDVGTLTVTSSFGYTSGNGSIDDWLDRQIPQDESGISYSSTLFRGAIFSPDGRYLYIHGQAAGMDANQQPLVHGFGLTVIDVSTGETLATALAGERITHVVPAPDGRILYAVRDDQHEDDAQTTLLRLDARTLDIRAERTVDSYPQIIVDLDQTAAPPPEPEASVKYLNVVTWDGVVTIDADTGDEIYSVDAYNPYSALSPDGSMLYVLGTDGSDGLVSIDASSGDEVWSTTVRHHKSYHYGMGPDILSVSPDGTRIYVHSYDNVGDFGDYGANAANVPNWVHVIDAETGEHLFDTEKIPGYCHAQVFSSPDSDLIHEICINTGQIRTSDAESGELLDTTRSESRIAGLHQSPDNGTVYLIGDTIRIFDTATGEVIDPPALSDVPVAPNPFGLSALSPDGALLFVGIDPRDGSNPPDVHEIAVFDTVTWEQVNRITVDVPLKPGVLGVSNDETFLYASERPQSENTGKVIRIDLATGDTSTLLVWGSEILRLVTMTP